MGTGEQFSDDQAHTHGTRRGEEMSKHDGSEKGRHDMGTSHSDRPAKQRTARDSTGINPDDFESVTGGRTIPPA
jgi:hypothetical protein